MNKWQIFILILICFLLTTVVFGTSISSEKRNTLNFEKILIGFWCDGYPVGNSYGYGYIFKEDHTFVYKDHNSYNLQFQYSGTIGRWNIQGNIIKILPKKSFYWKKKWVNDPNYGLDPGEGNSLYSVASKVTKWTAIGDIRFYSEAKQVIKGDQTLTTTKPANIFLKRIVNDQISEYPNTEGLYWHLVANYLDVSETKDIIDYYKDIK